MRFVWPIDRTITGSTTPCQGEPGDNGNEGVRHIPQISRTKSSATIVA